MKSSPNPEGLPVRLVSIAACVAFFIAVVAIDIAYKRGHEHANMAWRVAATPVFEARGMPEPQKRKPHDLVNALNAEYAVTYYERVKLSPYWPGHGQGTKVTIASAAETAK